MRRYCKLLLLMSLASAAFLFVSRTTAFALFQDEEEEYDEGYEQEYAAWEAADKEADPLKSGTMLIEFLQKNPQSKLLPYAEGSYRQLLFKCNEAKNYQALETLAEQWNTIKPGDKETLGLIATAARELKHDDKYLQTLEAIYKLDPTTDWALSIALIYKGKKDDANYLKWLEPVLKAPEQEANFNLRYELMNYYIGKKDTTKTLEYARATLASIDKVKDPSAEIAKALPELRRAINDTIGRAHYADKKFDQAIAAFQNALKAQRYTEGYYWIGNCLWEQNKADNAILAFAKAQLLGEKGDADDKATAAKAKDRMEQLYKALHNNTTIGIDKQYRKAQDLKDDDVTKPVQ